MRLAQLQKGLLGLLALGSAAAQTANLAGYYTLQHFREVGSELLLKSDGSFDFMLAYGAADYWAKGTWRVENGSVILSSTSRAARAPFRLLESKAVKSAAIRVHVVGANQRGVPNIDVTLVTEKGKHQARTDSDGIALFPREDAPRSAAFQIRVYHVDTEPIALNAAHDDFTFEIDGKAITELIFQDERMVVSGKTLTMTYWGPDQEMHYVREK
jgi:hypothetical protein